MKRTGTSKKTNKQYTYYCCEFLNSKDESRKCDFMTWDVPVKDDCPVCGQTMFKRAGRGFKKPFCINPVCSNFLPEEKRGYPSKPAQAKRGRRGRRRSNRRGDGNEKAWAKKLPSRKPPRKKPAAKKNAAKAASKPPPPAAAKTAAKKTTTAKKPAAKKTSGEKDRQKAGDED